MFTLRVKVSLNYLDSLFFTVATVYQVSGYPSNLHDIQLRETQNQLIVNGLVRNAG